MKYFLGMDGGGTKTACLLIDESGKTISTVYGKSISHTQHGVKNVIKTIKELILQNCAEASIEVHSLSGVCIGLPALGEFPDKDVVIVKSIKEISSHVHITNDAEVGWAGALECQPGINVVAGTGSIVFGSDDNGNTMRCSGWSKTYSDEGSAYWLGMRGMGLFCKQSDGRAPKGPLYQIVRKHFGLSKDFDFMTVAESDILPYRDKVAAFQKIVAEAGRDGDTAVQLLYSEAAEELCNGAKAVRDGLDFLNSPVRVSYTGGVFLVGDMILNPFTELVIGAGMSLTAPSYSPEQGAVLLGVKSFAPEFYNQICGAWLI